MNYKSKLIELYDDEFFGTEAIDGEAGIMINEYNEVVDFLILTFEDRIEVYLNLYDEEAPYRNILAKGVAAEIEEAKDRAIANLNRQVYINIH
ncbi:hypothetical protein [Peribacillus asahii]|uniref:hypothetical protein n=1 Tax=Peribacillus asahii TaxID=228899 RepID=UPI003806CFA9